MFHCPVGCWYIIYTSLVPVNPLRPKCHYSGFVIMIHYKNLSHASGYEPGIKTIQFYMKSPSNLYKTHWNTTGQQEIQALTSHRKQLIFMSFCMMQSLAFGLCIITSAYYSLRKWDHLQMNCLFMGSKTMYNLL